MSDEGCGVQLPLGNEGEDLPAAAAVHPAGLEGEVFAVHVGEGEDLRGIVQGHHGDDGVGPGAGPGQGKGALAPRHLQHPVRAPVGAVSADKVGGSLRTHGQHLGIMGLHKGSALRVFLADDDLTGSFQQYTLEGTQAGGTSTDDQHRIFVADLGNVGGPVAGGQDVPHKEGLLIGDPVGDLVQPLVSVGNPHILRLASVNAAAQGPAAVGVGAVVDPAVFAEKALSTEGLHVDSHPVAGAHRGDGGAHFLHDTYHLVTNRDAGHRPGHRAVLDVQVAGADAGQGDPDDGVPVILQYRLGLFHQGKGTLFDVGIGQHGGFLLVQNGGGLEGRRKI